MPISFVPYTAVYGPLSVPGCGFWFDAADSSSIRTSSGSNISSWSNKANSSSGFPSAGVGRNIVYTNGTPINGLNTVYFIGNSSGTGSSLNLPTFNVPSSTWTSFFVFKGATALAGANNGYFLWNPTSNYTFSDFVVYNVTSFPTTYFMLNETRSDARYILYFPPTDAFFSNASMGTIIANGTSTTGGFFNGNQITNTGASTPGVNPSGATGAAEYSIGSIGRTDEQSFYLGEMIIYYSVLSTPQRQAIEGYLAQKWGLTSQLPAGHPGLTQTLYNGKVYQPQISLKPAPYANYYPLSIGGCQLWMDGADPAGTGTAPANGATVSTWVDKSASGNAPNVLSGLTYSRTQQNTLGTVNFGNFTGYLSGTITPALQNSVMSCFFIFKLNGTTSDNGIHNVLDFANGPNGDLRMLEERAGNFRFLTRNPNTLGISTPANTGVYNIWFAGQNTTNLYARLNGTSLTPASISANTSNSSQYGIGTNFETPFATPSGWNGYVGEVIIYNSLVSISQQEQIEGYLAWKWGLQSSLPITHPYYSAPPLQYTRGAILGAPSLNNIARLPPIVATGGTITFSGSYKIHTFTTVGSTNFTITQPYATQLQVLIVGGGGGGGNNCGGGGGAGGVAFLNSQSVAAGSYSVIVGAGGAGGINPGAPIYGSQGSNGTSSTAFGLTGIGGGGGGWSTQAPYVQTSGTEGGCGGGGAGGGATAPSLGGTALQRGGFTGGGQPSTSGPNYGGGGGGGMGSVGSNGSGNTGGNGGNGASYTIGGTAYTLAGGGGGGTYNASGGSGGSGGAGAGAGSPNISGGNATYYGSGGGGSAGGGVATAGGSGYQGIVIIAYDYL